MLTSNYVKCFMLCNYMTVCKHLYPSLHILLFLLQTVLGEGDWISVQGSVGDVRSVCSTAAGGSQTLQLAPGTLRAAQEEDFPPLSISFQ